MLAPEGQRAVPRAGRGGGDRMGMLSLKHWLYHPGPAKRWSVSPAAEAGTAGLLETSCGSHAEAGYGIKACSWSCAGTVKPSAENAALIISEETRLKSIRPRENKGTTMLGKPK